MATRNMEADPAGRPGDLVDDDLSGYSTLSGDGGGGVAMDTSSRDGHAVMVSMLQGSGGQFYHLTSAGILETHDLVFVGATDDQKGENEHVEEAEDQILPQYVINKTALVPEEQVTTETSGDETSVRKEEVENQIGEYVLYFCKSCVYHSTLKQEVADHVTSGCCVHQNSRDADSILRAAALMALDGEHNYAAKTAMPGPASVHQNHSLTSEPRSQTDVGNETGLSTADNQTHSSTSDRQNLPSSLEHQNLHSDAGAHFLKPSISEAENCLLECDNPPETPTELICSECPHTELYSDRDLAHHSRCHQASGHPHLFLCYICQTESKKTRGRPLGITGDWQKLKVHLDKVHQVDFSLPCPSCEQVFRSHVDLDRHKTSHWKCPYSVCRYQADRQEELCVHVKCHKSDKSCRFQCYLCQYEHPQLPGNWHMMHDHLVSSHENTEAVRTRFKCQRCGKGFQQKPQFDHHYKDCTLPLAVCAQCGKSVNLQKPHECPAPQSPATDVQATPEKICDAISDDIGEKTADVTNEQTTCHRHNITFDCRQDFERHLLEAHSRYASKRKSYTDFMTEDLDEKTVRRQQSYPPVTGSRSVTAAGQNVSSEPAAESAEPAAELAAVPMQQDDSAVKDANPPPDAQGAYSDNKEFSVLKKKRGRKKLLSDPSKAIKCPVCYKKFANDCRLDMHVTRCHTTDKLQKVCCGICPKLFRNQVQRRNHVRTVHEGVKRKPSQNPGQKSKIYYLCSACNYLTPDKTRLRNHELAVHHGIMPYACQVCEYKTKEKSDLERHKLKHQGIKRHQCRLCAYQTNERWCLVNHCSKQHNVHLPRQCRDTMGCALSMRWQARRRKLEQQQLQEQQQALLEQQQHVLEYTHLLSSADDTTTYMVTPDADAQPVLVEHMEDEPSTSLADTTTLLNQSDADKGQLIQVAQEVDIVASGTVEEPISGLSDVNEIIIQSVDISDQQFLFLETNTTVE